MGWTSSITVPSMVGIVGHAPAVDEKTVMFITGSHAGIVLTQWSKNGFFAPQGRRVAR